MYLMYEYFSVNTLEHLYKMFYIILFLSDITPYF